MPLSVSSVDSISVCEAIIDIHTVNDCLVSLETTKFGTYRRLVADLLWCYEIVLNVVDISAKEFFCRRPNMQLHSLAYIETI